MTTDDVFDALCVEGVKLARRYLPRPLFAEEMLRDQKTYGDSRFPFAGADYRAPRLDDFPGVASFDRKWMLMPWGHRVPRSCIRQVERAFQKVLGELSSRRPHGP